MKIAIIPFGNLGCTSKAAEILRKEIENSEISDTLGDISILGTNVRFGKFNKRFLKFVKKNIAKSGSDSKIFVYIVGAEIERADHYIDEMRKLLPTAVAIRYVWGTLETEGASRMEKFAIESFTDGRRKDGLPKPRLLEKELRALASEVAECCKI